MYSTYTVLLGNKDCRMFVLGGDALDDARTGQSLTQSGMVVVSPAVWKVCSRDKFFPNAVGNSKFVEIIQVSTCVHTGMYIHIEFVTVQL